MNEREIKRIKKEDAPIKINPSQITHSIVVCDSKTIDVNSINRSQFISSIQNALNPNYCNLIVKYHKLGKMSSIDYLAAISQPITADLLYPVLDEMKIPNEYSVFLRIADVSLDYLKTKHEVLALFVFKESTSRIIISDKEPYWDDSMDKAVNTNQKVSQTKKPKWKFW